MKVAVVGTGYVGLVGGTSLSSGTLSYVLTTMRVRSTTQAGGFHFMSPALNSLCLTYMTGASHSRHA